MRILKENTDNDLEMGAANQLTVLAGIDAVAQAATSTMEAQQGEMQYDVSSGIPMDKTLWSGVPNLPQFEFFSRRALLLVEGITDVTSFIVVREGDGVAYSAALNTIFGPTNVAGVIGGV